MSVNIQSIVASQKDFFYSNATKDIHFRLEQLRKLKNMLQHNAHLLDEAIYQDMGKSPFENYATELALIYSELNHAIRYLKKWAKPKQVSGNLLNFPATGYIIPEPIGTVLVISAWNYPYQLSLSPVVAAMAAGCTIILKPSELPVQTAHLIARLVSENFDPRYFTVVEGSVAETTKLLEQPFDKIFFTGSPAVGKIVYRAAARNLIPVILELGGKSPVFVTENCHISMTARRLVWAKFLNAGQTCIAPDYILVHHSIKQKLLEQLKKEIEKAHYSVDNGNYIRIINEKNMSRLIGMLDQAKVFWGGGYQQSNRYIEPTILSQVSFDDPVMQEEIFGPILPVIAYQQLDEAIREVKKRPKPLSCYVFTQDKKVASKIIREVSFGGGAVNDAVMHITHPYLPFGGVGNSGMGAYHGKEGFKAFTHYKSILDKPTWFESNMKYYPYTKKKYTMMKILFEKTF